MDIEINEQAENKLFDREELKLTISHPQEATPSANAVRKQLAAELDADPVTIGIDHIYSSSGSSTSTATVKIYAEPIMDELPDEEADDEPDEETGDDAAEPDDEEAADKETSDEDDEPDEAAETDAEDTSEEPDDTGDEDEEENA